MCVSRRFLPYRYNFRISQINEYSCGFLEEESDEESIVLGLRVIVIKADRSCFNGRLGKGDGTVTDRFR